MFARITVRTFALLACVGFAAAGCKDDKGTSGGGGGAAAADLSTPKAAAQSFAKAVTTGDNAGIRATTTGTEEQYKMAEAMGGMLKSMADLRAAATAKYGADNPISKDKDMDIAKDIDEAEFKTEGDVATMVKKTNPNDKDPLKLKKVDGKWKVDLGSMPASESAQITKMAPAMKKACDEVAAEINSGKHATADAAQTAMGQKMAAAMGMPDLPTKPTE